MLIADASRIRLAAGRPPDDHARVVNGRLSAQIGRNVGETRPRSFVSAQQVAELAGVSRSAVSRTFTDGASVSDATRRKVMQAADRLGYHVNHLARSLIQEASGIVCLIGADLNTPYQSRMLDALTRRLQAIDRIGMVINTSGESDRVEDALRQTLNYRAAATIVLSGTPPATLITTCVNSGQRVILINRDDHVSGPVHISVDNAAAAREALHVRRRRGCAAPGVAGRFLDRRCGRLRRDAQPPRRALLPSAAARRAVAAVLPGRLPRQLPVGRDHALRGPLRAPRRRGCRGVP